MLGNKMTFSGAQGDDSTRDRILFEATRLIAQKGYAALSMRELANVIGIKPSSLYHHFEGKEALMDAILDNVSELYSAYFARLEEANRNAKSFEEILDNMFLELKTIVSIHIFYGFSVVMTEQFLMEKAGKIFLDVFNKYSIESIQRTFDDCVKRKIVPAFDTVSAANLLMNTVWVTNELRVHEDLGHPLPYDLNENFDRVKAFLLAAAENGIGA